MGKALKLPKTECCVSKTRCDRCPIRMLKDGTLPSGYGVRKRKLVRFDASGTKVKKVKKAELVAAVRTQKTKKKTSKKKQLAA